MYLLYKRFKFLRSRINFVLATRRSQSVLSNKQFNGNTAILGTMGREGRCGQVMNCLTTEN